LHRKFPSLTIIVIVLIDVKLAGKSRALFLLLAEDNLSAGIKARPHWSRSWHRQSEGKVGRKEDILSGEAQLALLSGKSG
jgi:hypothetical protein